MAIIEAIIDSKDKEAWVFELNKIIGEVEKYFVTGTNGRSTVSFELRKKFGSWKIIPPAPAFVFSLEARFASLIEREST